MKSIDEIIRNDVTGLYYGNRLILPFAAHFLKVIIDDKIITDFSPGTRGITITENEGFTDVYFHYYKILKEVVTEYEAIKMLVVEKGKDIFDTKNHKKLVIYLKEKHTLKVEETNEDILFLD